MGDWFYTKFNRPQSGLLQVDRLGEKPNRPWGGVEEYPQVLRRLPASRSPGRIARLSIRPPWGRAHFVAGLCSACRGKTVTIMPILLEIGVLPVITGLRRVAVFPTNLVRLRRSRGMIGGYRFPGSFPICGLFCLSPTVHPTLTEGFPHVAPRLCVSAFI